MNYIVQAMSVPFLLLGCGGGVTAGTPDPDVGSSFSELVTVADGGVLETAAGWATLMVAPESLVEDVTLTLGVVEEQAISLSSTYEFGPAGTGFDPPARLEISWDGSIGTGAAVGLALLEAGAWKPLGATWRDGAVVVGEIEHFSTIAVAEVDKPDVCRDGSGGSSPHEAYSDELEEWVDAEGCTLRIKDCKTADEYNVSCEQIGSETPQCSCLGMPEDLFPSGSFEGTGCFGTPSQAFVDEAMARCGYAVVYEYDAEYFLWDG